MSAKSVTRSRRLIARLGSLLAAALCVGSLAVFSPSASAASQNSGITSGKVYRIINLGSGKYLNVTGGRDQDDINVNQYTGDGTNTQDLIIRWVSAESCYKIYPICSSNGSGRVLHIARSGSAPANGGNAVIKTASSADAASQRFQIDTVGHNLFYIRPTSKNSLYLTANGNGNGTWTGTGANTAGNVVAKTKSTGNNDDKRHQMWIIVEKTQYASYSAHFPFSDYADIEYYTKDGKACPKDKKIHDSCNRCISFWGGSQCVAFAREIYARSFGGIRLSDDHVTAGKCSDYGTDNLSPLKTYIQNNVGYGGHIRVKQANKNEHSLIVAHYNSTGVQIYDANHSGVCDISYRFLTYAEFAKQYTSIRYSHKGKHTHTYTDYKSVNGYAHAKFCTKCDADAHSALEQHAYNGKPYCTACGYKGHIIEPWDASNPEETNAASEPEEQLTPSAPASDEPTVEEFSAEIEATESLTSEEISAEESAAENPLLDESATEETPEETPPVEDIAEVSGAAPALDPALLPEEDE